VTQIIRPTLNLLGINFELTIRRRGYYPVGGGIAELSIHPCREIRAVNLPERRLDSSSALILSRCAMLPRHVAERQHSAALHLLRQRGVPVGESVIEVEEASSPGSSILVALLNDHCMIGADALGRRGVRAESVGEEAARRFLTCFDSGASVDPNLADNIAPLLCLSKSSSKFFVPAVTDHLRTSLHVARVFTGADFEFSKAASSWLVTVTPKQQNS
jgi:RNA 3'-terminal phosphate cyclase (ATP)